MRQYEKTCEWCEGEIGSRIYYDTAGRSKAFCSLNHLQLSRLMAAQKQQFVCITGGSSAEMRPVRG